MSPWSYTPRIIENHQASHQLRPLVPRTRTIERRFDLGRCHWRSQISPISRIVFLGQLVRCLDICLFVLVGPLLIFVSVSGVVRHTLSISFSSCSSNLDCSINVYISSDVLVAYRDDAKVNYNKKLSCSRDIVRHSASVENFLKLIFHMWRILFLILQLVMSTDYHMTINNCYKRSRVSLLLSTSCDGRSALTSTTPVKRRKAEKAAGPELVVRLQGNYAQFKVLESSKPLSNNVYARFCSVVSSHNRQRSTKLDRFTAIIRPFLSNFQTTLIH